jgi:hypothetical protein
VSECVRFLLGVDNHQPAGNVESVSSMRLALGASWDAALDVVPRAIPRVP